MKEKIVESLQTRLQVEVVAQNPLKVLKQIKLEDIIDTAIPVIYLYTRGKSSEDSPVYMTELVCAIGHAIMSKEFLPKNSGLAAKIGAFILYSFEELNLLKVKIGAGIGSLNISYMIRCTIYALPFTSHCRYPLLFSQPTCLC